MEEQEIFKNKAENGYEVCFATKCPLKNQCLRWLVGQQIPATRSFNVCVNPQYEGVGTKKCPLYRTQRR